jgi:hypothetical protein
MRDLIWTRGRPVVAVVEILGAGWGFVALLHLLFTTPGVVVPWSFLVLFFGWFTLAGYAGVGLLRQRRGGWTLSVVSQAAQLLQVTFGPVAYRLIAGPQATVFLTSDRLGFFTGMTGAVNLTRGQADPPFVLGLNLVAVAFLVVLAQRPGQVSVAHAA